MLKKLITILVALAIPAGASAESLKAAIEKAGRELALAQAPDTQTRSRGRFWTGIALLAGGGTHAALGSFEIGDDETGPDDGEDVDDSDDGEDSDGVNKGLVGGGAAAAGVGAWLLLTGRKSGPVVSARPGSVIVRQTVRF
jgi:hypothetical protein